MLWCCIFFFLFMFSKSSLRQIILRDGNGAWSFERWLPVKPPPPVMDVLFFFSLQSGGSEQERTKKKRRGDRYSVQTSLIVAALKKLLPIGLNMCSPADQELINLAKIRYSLVQ